MVIVCAAPSSPVVSNVIAGEVAVHLTPSNASMEMSESSGLITALHATLPFLST